MEFDIDKYSFWLNNAMICGQHDHEIWKAICEPVMLGICGPMSSPNGNPVELGDYYLSKMGEILEVQMKIWKTIP